MTTFLVTLAFFGGIMALMGVGAMVNGKRLKGSCGQDCRCSPLAANNCERK